MFGIHCWKALMVLYQKKKGDYWMQEMTNKMLENQFGYLSIFHEIGTYFNCQGTRNYKA